jgi:hypothetical protein
MCFENGRVINGNFCGERGVPSKYHEAYLLIKNQPLRLPNR